MGLASTQARLLYCTSRKADLQYDLLQACAQEQMYTQKSCVAAEQKARKYNEFIATQVGDPDNLATRFLKTNSIRSVTLNRNSA